MDAPSPKKSLPLFRQDLQLFQGPDEPNGAPSFNIFDPVKGSYYKISWGESLIIKHLKPGMTAEELCNSINSQSTLKVTPAEIKKYFEDAAKHNLLALPRPSSFLKLESEEKKQNPLTWLLMHYLYIRIPLFDPDEFLKRTLKYVKPLVSWHAFLLYGFFSSIGLIFLFLRMEEFAHTFTYFFNFKGFLFYALALTAVKIVHEFAHAYTAVNYHVRVPQMGIVFLVMWPVLFTDVTDAWKLKNRRHRAHISLAGIVVETVIAGLCTFGWAMTSSGILKSLFFVVSAVSWMSTLFVNANPAMRFDGYYILSDLWGIDNLQSRAFALARWRLRDWVLGLRLQCPEPKMSDHQMRWMVFYAIVTWAYRLILYTAIAIFVYHSFTKALGIFLFLLEIGVFIIWPLLSEARVLLLLRSRLKFNARIAIFSLALFILFLWLAIPFPRSDSFVAITIPHQEQTLYVPSDAIIEAILVKRGKQVSQGEMLVKLRSRKLESDLRLYSADAEISKQKIKILGLEDAGFAHIPEHRRELEGIMAKKNAAKSKLEELTILADIDGKVISWDDNLRVNQSVSKDRVMGKIADVKSLRAVSFVPESLLYTVHQGQDAEFVLRGGGKYKGKIESINPVRATKLLFPSLASTYKGDLPVYEDADKNLILIESYFPVTAVLQASESELGYDKVGTLHVQGPKRSLLVYYLHKLVSLFWQESGF